MIKHNEHVFSQTHMISNYKEQTNNNEFSNSRSRSPYCEGGAALRHSSNSPMRLMQKQQKNSSLLLNAHNFSNIKKDEASNCCQD